MICDSLSELLLHSSAVVFLSSRSAKRWPEKASRVLRCAAYSPV